MCEETFPIYYMTIPVDSLAAIITLIEVTAVIMEHHLRKRKAFLLISVLLAGYLLAACGNLYSTINSIVSYTVKGDTVICQRSCFWRQLLLMIGYITVTDVCLIIAIDRAAAIILPIWYNQRYKLWLLTMQILLIPLHAIGINSGIYANIKDELIPYCTALSDGKNSAMILHLTTSNILLAVTVIIYIALIAWVKCKLYKDSETSDAVSNHHRQLRSKLLFTLAFSLFIHAFTVCLATIIGGIAVRAGNIRETIAIGKYGSVAVANGLLNSLFLYFRMPEIRIAVLKMGRKINRISTFASISKVLPITSGKLPSKTQGLTTTQ
ncbi:hypothetical protein M514_04726 [Trichuris suis]|uniref:G-protein coupled receptors family 1 profile domain-containing protein n=1 Tax=Trichuris suis TaxID=68888 RepID=A0A085N8J2_9BILA|nr:hypothetical protein M513_04726 [Trichuris suis]KFD65788.1 hypothetical protein M514_04726 [Trichuris suis]